MSNYIKSVDFAAKDSLLTGNPLKIVSGTEIDDEFNALQTAVNSKADVNSPALTGTPTAPTATAGTNTTQIATTAFVTAADTSLQSTLNSAIQALHPVGSIYINATDSTNPADLFGFGTWVRFGKGRVLVSQDDSNSLFNAAEETGGSADATLVSHSHTATSTVTDPGHTHGIPSGNDDGASPSSDSSQNTTRTDETNSATTGITVSTSISTEGSSATNANYQPYITVYMWKRTA